MVEHNLAKVGVASSNLVSRSKENLGVSTSLNDRDFFLKSARMVELVDTPDLKSCACMGVRVQVPLRVREMKEDIVLLFLFIYMATIYILHSESLNKFYVGSCKDLVERLAQHLNKTLDNAFLLIPNYPAEDSCPDSSEYNPAPRLY